MSDQYRIDASPRETRGKQVKQLREQGLTPIVVYGRKTEPLTLQTTTRELVRVLHQAGGTQLIAIHIDGESGPRMTLAKDVQLHVTKLTPLHADFLQVVMDEKLVQEIPLQIVGEPDVVKNTEAIVGVELNRVQVRALPGDLPPFIEIDVSVLDEVGDSFMVGDIEDTDTLEIVSDPELLIARIFIPTMQVEEEEAEGEEELEEALVDGELPEGEEADAEADGAAEQGEEE